jgi:hypothetical protein
VRSQVIASVPKQHLKRAKDQEMRRCSEIAQSGRGGFYAETYDIVRSWIRGIGAQAEGRTCLSHIQCLKAESWDLW